MPCRHVVPSNNYKLEQPQDYAHRYNKRGVSKPSEITGVSKPLESNCHSKGG